MNTYSIPKPSFPVSAWLLGVLVIIGLIGLGVAAYAAFAFIGRPAQALAFALVIEAGMISEAIAIIRRNWLSIPGLVVSLAVSISYNYTQAAQAGALLAPPITDPLQLAALSIGPLSAVFFLALAAGHELREHEKRLAVWENARQTWLDNQAAEEKQAWQAEAELARLAELETRRLELEYQERERKRGARRAARASRVSTQTERAITQPERVITQNQGKGTYEDYVLALRERNGSGPFHVDEIQARFHVSRKTAYNWINRRAAELPETIPQAN